MGNIVATLKRFIQNKNTVTILAVLAGIIILWYFYNYRVNQAITTIKVPYARERIDTNKPIETDNIDYMEITQSTLKDNDIVQNVDELTDKYVCMGTSIPKNGFFHKSQICDKEELPNSVLENVEDGYTLFSLPVTMETTYANSITPHDYIDLQMSARDDSGTIIFGKLIESIEVQEVRDGSGKNVFWDSSAGDPASLLFIVPDDYANLLNIAKMINVTIVPVLRGASYTQNPGETNVSSEELRAYILNKANIYGED